ncbi:hypothetical protein FA95DRAFT_1269792, partial [Auriscalpium vulgare]
MSSSSSASDPDPDTSTPKLTASPSSSQDRIVRFDDACVLIPAPAPRSRLPKLLTKSYSLPIFKRRPSPGPRSPPPTDEPPSFNTSLSKSKNSPSPSRGRPRDDVPALHLQPCLVHPGPHSAGPRMPPRRASLPPPAHGPRVTVPLRECCAACFSGTESAGAAGWTETFSRAARRRRSASVDLVPAPVPAPPRRPSSGEWVLAAPVHAAFAGVSVDEAAKRVGEEPVEGGDETPPDEDDESDEAYLPALLAHRAARHSLSPIQSTNASTDDLPAPATPLAPAPP